MSIYRVIWIILMGSYGLGCFFFYIGRNIEIGNRIRWQRRFLLWKKIFTYQILKYKEKILQEKKLELRKKAIRNDIEIFHSSIMLKNLAIAERGNAFSADYMYEKLLEQANRLRPIYAEMLTLYRGGRDKEAFTLFAEKGGTKAARNFSMVLSKLDQIDPAELVEQMEVFQEALMQQKVTTDIKRMQQTSAVSVFLATASVFAQLINFVVVVVLMNAMNTIRYLF